MTIEEILAIRPTAGESVEMPEWGRTVHVREMSAADRDKFEIDIAGGGMSMIRAHLVARTACDEHGVRLFSDDQIETLAKLPASQIVKVYRAATKLNSITEDEIDELEKNS